MAKCKTSSEAVPSANVHKQNAVLIWITANHFLFDDEESNKTAQKY